MIRIASVRVALFVALTSGILNAAAPALAQGSGAASRPNIVMIISDDMGYSDLGCYGGEIETPHLDELAAGGLRFANYYSNNMCVVARASLMTGCYPGVAKPRGSLNPNCVTAPELLRNAGYTTLMSGKWHLSDEGREGSPNDRGFDHWYGTYMGAGSFFTPASLTRDDRNVEHEFRENPDYYYTDAITDNAINFLNDSHTKAPDKPFFLYLAYTAAHWPLHAKEEDIAHYKGRFSMGWDKLRKQRHARLKKMGLVDPKWPLSPRHPDVPAWQDEEHKAWQERRMEVYAAQVTSMDRNIGRVVKWLRDRGRLDNTLILYQNDNGGCHVEYTRTRKGAYLPEKTRDGRPVIPGNRPDVMPGPENTYQSYGYGWANASNTPFRLFKQHDHEGGIRSPLIAHWPAGIAARGDITKQVCHVTDLLPTFIELAGTKYPNQFNGNRIVPHVGRSLVRALEGDKAPARESYFWKHSRGKAVRIDDWKLVSENRKPWELYRLTPDGTELDDLAGSHPQKAAELRKRFEDWDTRTNKKPAKKKKRK